MYNNKPLLLSLMWRYQARFVAHPTWTNSNLVGVFLIRETSSIRSSGNLPGYNIVPSVSINVKTERGHRDLQEHVGKRLIGGAFDQFYKAFTLYCCRQYSQHWALLLPLSVRYAKHNFLIFSKLLSIWALYVVCDWS